jgi:hypothetical protein
MNGVAFRGHCWGIWVTSRFSHGDDRYQLWWLIISDEKKITRSKLNCSSRVLCRCIRCKVSTVNRLDSNWDTRRSGVWRGKTQANVLSCKKDLCLMNLQFNLFSESLSRRETRSTSNSKHLQISKQLRDNGNRWMCI